MTGISVADKINFIKRAISILSVEACASAGANLNDSNILLEGFCKEFFQIVLNINLIGTNTEVCNFGGVDLLSNDNKTAFQITTNSNFDQKFKKCIEIVKKKSYSEKLKTLYIVFFRNLSAEEKKSKRKLKKDNKLKFDIKIIELGDFNKYVLDSVHQVDNLFDLCNRYVPLKKYESPILSVCDNFIERTVSLINDGGEGEKLFDFAVKCDRVVLLSDAAFGKTEEMKNLNNLFCKAGKSPYYYALKNYSGENIEQLIPEELLSCDAILLFDAYDEIVAEYIEKFNRHLNTFATKYPHIKIILSSRLNYYHKNLGCFENFKEVFLNDLTEKDINNYLQLRLNDKSAGCLELCNKNGISDLLYNPFYLVNIADLIACGKSFSNRIDLMEKLFGTAFNRDLKHLNRNKVSESEFKNLLSNLALKMIGGGVQFCPLDEINKNYICFSWIKEENGNLGFSHSVYKEYLAAVALSGKTVNEIKEIISIDVIKTYIRPQFYNTLSFLMELRDDIGFKNFILSCGKSFILDLEPIQLSGEQKYELVTSIFEEYDLKRSWIDAAFYEIKNIAKLCDTIKIIDYVISLIDKKRFRTTIVSALETLKNVKNLYGKKNLIVSKLVGWLSDSEILGDDYMLYELLITIGELKPEKELIISLFNTFSSHPRSQVREAANHMIYKNGLGEEFVKRFTANKIPDTHRFMIDSDDSYFIGEGMYASLAIKQIKDQDTLSDLGLYLAEKIKKHEQSMYYEPFFETVENLDNLSEKLKTAIFKLLINCASLHLYSAYINAIKKLIEKFKLNGEFLNLLKVGDYDVLQKIDVFATLYCIETESEILGALKQKEYEEYSVYLANRFAQIPDIEKKFNDAGIKCRIDNDCEKRRKEREQIEFNNLFDLDEIKSEIVELYKKTGKEIINWDEVEKFDCKNGFCLPDYISALFADGPLKVGDIINGLNENWQIIQIYNKLSRLNEFSVSEKQKEFIIRWCNKHVDKIDFSTAIKYTENGYSASWIAVCCSFFIEKFDLSVKACKYAELVAFGYGYGSDRDFSQLTLLEEKLGEKETKTALQNHLEQGKLQNFVLLNRIAYCIDRGWDICENYIIEQLGKFDNIDTMLYRYFIEYMIKFNHTDNLLFYYDNFNTEIKINIIDISKKYNNSLCVGYVEKDILNCNKDAIELATALLQFSSKTALDYYTDWVDKNNKFYSFGKYTHLQINGFDSIDVLPHFIKLLDLSYSVDEKDDETETIRRSINAVFNNIAMNSLDNLIVVVKSLNEFIGNATYEDIGFENYYIDNMISSFLKSNVII